MKQPELRTRVLASPPVFYGTWGIALWLGYEWTQHSDAWPLLVFVSFMLVGVMNADAQLKAYESWRREWDAMSGAPPRLPLWHWIASVGLAIPVFAFLLAIGQQGGVRAVIGVLMITLGPAFLIALLVKFLRRAFRQRTDRVVLVSICVAHPLIAVPTLDDAYNGLPEHCLRVLEPLA